MMLRAVQNILTKWIVSLLCVVTVDLFYKGSFMVLKKSYNCKPRKWKKAIYYSYVKKHSSWIGINSIIGDNLILPHGIYGIFISDHAVIGSNVTIFHQVTVGSNRLKGSKRFGSPNISDGVLLGAGAKVIGKVSVGKNVRIGANAVVMKDVPDNCTVVIGVISIIQRDENLDNTLIPI